MYCINYDCLCFTDAYYSHMFLYFRNGINRCIKSATLRKETESRRKYGQYKKNKAEKLFKKKNKKQTAKTEIDRTAVNYTKQKFSELKFSKKKVSSYISKSGGRDN